ncbi:MAG: hypothetical protein WC916_00790 [Candidatus Woesearchaeota archaeon]
MEKEINAIKERNKRVEADKAWETSITRRAIIAVLTYIIIVIFLMIINIPNPWLNALVPTAGFMLSTLTLSVVKDWWLENVYKK